MLVRPETFGPYFNAEAYDTQKEILIGYESGKPAEGLD